MANKTMHHVVIGSDTYEIVDEQGRENIAPPFSTSTTYAAGDYVIYSGKLYQFTVSHSGAWTGADAEETTVAEDISQLKEDIQNINGVPNTVRHAIFALLSKATYTETGLTDEKAIVEEWASVTAVGIVLSEQSISFDGEGTHQLRAILTPPDSTDEPLWSTSDANVAVVSQTGLVSTVGNGSCTISASIGSLVATCNVTVSGVVCSVVNTLTNCTNSNAATTIEAGSSYSATLIPTTDFTLSEVTVTMNGEDVTSTVYADGEISIPSVTGNIIIVAKAYIIAAWDMSLGRVPSTDDGITYTPATSAFTAAFDSTNGLVLTGTGSTNIKYEPTGHTTINKGSFEMTYTIVSAAINGQLNPRMSDGTSGANIAITRTNNLGYHVRETLASSDDYDVIMNSYTLNTEYTMKVEYEKGVGVVVYIDGEKVYESATESTYYATSTKLFAMSTIKCYIKSMKWIIEEVA